VVTGLIIFLLLDICQIARGCYRFSQSCSRPVHPTLESRKFCSVAHLFLIKSDLPSIFIKATALETTDFASVLENSGNVGKTDQTSIRR